MSKPRLYKFSTVECRALANDPSDKRRGAIQFLQTNFGTERDNWIELRVIECHEDGWGDVVQLQLDSIDLLKLMQAVASMSEGHSFVDTSRIKFDDV